MYQFVTSALPMMGIYYTIILHFLDFKNTANLRDPVKNVLNFFINVPEKEEIEYFTNVKQNYFNRVESKDINNLPGEEFVDRIILKEDKLIENFSAFNEIKKNSYRYSVLAFYVFIIIIISRLRMEQGTGSMTIFGR